MCLRQQTSTFQTRLLFSARRIGRVDYVLLSNGVSVKRASADDTYQQNAQPHKINYPSRLCMGPILPIRKWRKLWRCTYSNHFCLREMNRFANAFNDRRTLEYPFISMIAHI